MKTRVQTFKCPKCDAWYWRGWLNYFLTIHVFRYRLHKCPRCGKLIWVKPIR